MKILQRVLATLLLLLQLSACTAPVAESPSITLNVMAAASLSEAFQEMAPAFEAAHPDVTVQFNFGGSQQLAQQLANGAPADVFASANNRQMQVTIDAGRVEPDAPASFAHNRLVVILPGDNPAGVAALADLAQPGLKLVLAASEVPAGQYSLEFLEKSSKDPTLGSDYSAKVLANVVSYEQTVKAVLAKVALGEADAGIVYSSDTASASHPLLQIEIPDALNVRADYPIAPVSNSPHPDLARAFIEWVRSANGQQVLEKYGFLPANSD